MPKLDTLCADIYDVLETRSGTPLNLVEWAAHGINMVEPIRAAIAPSTRGDREDKVIYATEIGKPCLRQTWYKYHLPELAEPVPPWTKFKFLYGTLVEEAVLALAKAAGHEVTDEQTVVEKKLLNGWTVRGRMDCMIDGVVVDVKSMSPYSFNEYKERGLTTETDKFGYRAQVNFYAREQLVYEVPRILGVDKVNGHIALFKAPLHGSMTEYQDNLLSITNALSGHIAIPRAFPDVAEGAKGNRKLGVECSYCEFKRACWPGLRGFAYAKGPVWLTKVVEEPKVKEIA